MEKTPHSLFNIFTSYTLNYSQSTYGDWWTKKKIQIGDTPATNEWLFDPSHRQIWIARVPIFYNEYIGSQFTKVQVLITKISRIFSSMI